jgi:osmotically-inducible protein OsmY
MRKACVVGVALVVWLSGVTWAAAQRHLPLTDDQIRAQVEHQLFDAGLVSVTVSVKGGQVTLAGTVPSLWVKDEAVKRARKVNDIKEVVSTLAVARGESDTDLAEAVAGTLRGSIFLTVFDDVSVMVVGGVATLTGSVTTPYKAQGMVEAVSRVEGVQQVINRIEVLPVSMFDDQIRYAVAARIYNDPAFFRYGTQANPPIHIIVKSGRVTLTGAVGSEMDRRLAEMLAREVFGVLGVENALRTDR